MKITGVLAEKGLHALTRASADQPRVWIVLVSPDEIEVWGKDSYRLEMIAGMRPDATSGDFMEDFYEWLIDARDQDVLDRIILVGSESVLRSFHDSMPTDALACVAAEIPHDFSTMEKCDRREALERLVCI